MRTPTIGSSLFLTQIFQGVLFLTIASTLLNIRAFVSPSISAYFFFLIMIGIVAIIAGAIFITGKNRTRINRNESLVPIIAIISLLIHACIIGQSIFEFKYFYLLSGCLFYIAICVLMRSVERPAVTIFKVIAALAATESVVCLLQYFGVINSLSDFFPVTGSWENPNVTAMFLAMAFPAVLALSITTHKKDRIFRVAIAMLLFGALAALKCRTALIGVIVVSLVYFNERFDVQSRFKTRRYNWKVLLGLLACVILLGILSGFLYLAKKDSSDGRLFIWTNCVKMILQKPVTGSGFGNFVRDYNLFQASYFQTDRASGTEIKNAAFVNTAYNELLQLAIEGGLPLLVLFGFIFYKLISRRNHIGHENKNFVLCKAGILAFGCMSLFNFTVEAVPVFCLFIIYAALLVTSSQEKSTVWLARFGKWAYTLSPTLFLRPVKTTGWVMVITGITICSTQAKKASGFLQIRQARSMMADRQTPKAISLLSSLEKDLKYSEIFQATYGKALADNKSYNKALDKYQCALTLSSDPGIYILAGNCYERLGRLAEAENAYRTAVSIVPGKFGSKVALMRFYCRQKDVKNARHLAGELLAMQPKTNTKILEIENFKKEAKRILEVSID